ncbi:Outer-membrane-phospholipid-binding lipoprotein MlaA [hydrothermal vent metagenome]|uniref:Outer-membrane-phospholipid-binding lipoprotein MlaA n=1 Tax=hydrothermal vent metagenome TaxID=652676 RepID=A0A3B1BET8_9ZZZZ
MPFKLASIKFYPWFILLSAILLTSGCASVPGPPEEHDPFESYNRAIYKFNKTVDDAAIRPVAQAYADYTPDFMQIGVSNFFSNLADVVVLMNDLLQFKIEQAGSDFYRIVVNSTLGVFGLFDPATHVGLPKHREDFGQTLAVWGVPDGPYFMIPFIGPSTVRDTSGFVVDIYTHPLFYTLVTDDTVAWGLVGLAYIDKRAELLGATRVLDEAALDPYIFMREAYLQHRRNLIYDGNPPMDYEEEFNDNPDDIDLELELEMEIELNLDKPKMNNTTPSVK